MTGERDSVGRLTHGSHCKLCFSSLYDLPCVFVCLCSEVKKTFTFEQLRDEASSKIGNQETWNHGQLSEISLTTSLQNAAPGGTSRRLFVSKRCRKRRPCTIAAARILLPTMGCFIGVSRGLTSLEKSMMWHMDQRCVFDDASWVRRWIIRSKILWWFYLRNTADVECFGSFPTNSKVVIYMPMIPEAGHPHSFASLDAGRGFDHAPLVTHWFQHTNRILSYSIPDIFRHVLAEQLRERHFLTELQTDSIDSHHRCKLLESHNRQCLPCWPVHAWEQCIPWSLVALQGSWARHGYEKVPKRRIFEGCGFAPRPELATRIKDAQPKALIWASCGVEPKGVLSCSWTQSFCGCWLVGHLKIGWFLWHSTRTSCLPHIAMYSNGFWEVKSQIVAVNQCELL